MADISRTMLATQNAPVIQILKLPGGRKLAFPQLHYRVLTKKTHLFNLRQIACTLGFSQEFLADYFESVCRVRCDPAPFGTHKLWGRFGMLQLDAAMRRLMRAIVCKNCLCIFALVLANDGRVQITCENCMYHDACADIGVAHAFRCEVRRRCIKPWRDRLRPRHT